jgi:hypothetical protein
MPHLAQMLVYHQIEPKGIVYFGAKIPDALKNYRLLKRTKFYAVSPVPDSPTTLSAMRGRVSSFNVLTGLTDQDEVFQANPSRARSFDEALTSILLTNHSFENWSLDADLTESGVETFKLIERSVDSFATVFCDLGATRPRSLSPNLLEFASQLMGRDFRLRYIFDAPGAHNHLWVVKR